MKERIIALLKRLNITLPEGWKPATSVKAEYHFEDTQNGYRNFFIQLNEDFSMTLCSPVTASQWEIPYEVMQALYVEVGRMSLSAEEYAHALDELAKHKEVLKALDDEHNQASANAARCIRSEMKLSAKDSLRRWHFHHLLKAKSELVKVAMRLHRQRERNSRIRRAFLKWAGHETTDDLNMAFCAEMSRALRVQPKALHGKPFEDPLLEENKQLRAEIKMLRERQAF